MINLRQYERERLSLFTKRKKTVSTAPAKKASKRYVTNTHECDDSENYNQDERDLAAQQVQDQEDDDVIIQQKPVQILMRLFTTTNREEFDDSVKNTVVQFTQNLKDTKREDFIDRSTFTHIQTDPIFSGFHDNWFRILENDHLAALKQCYIKAYANGETKILPKKVDVFNIFSADPFRIRCIIIGQDPYPGRGKDLIAHACGYSFATRSSTIPQSLRPLFALEDLDQERKTNYLVEMKKNKMPNYDAACDSAESYTDDLAHAEKSGTRQTLRHWIDRGFFMANTILTIEEGSIKSHEHIGWQDVMKKIFLQLNKRLDKYCVVCFGAEAQKLLCCFGKGRQFATKHPSAINRDPAYAKEFYDSAVFFNVWKYCIEQGLQ